jgi:hypothetical protein
MEPLKLRRVAIDTYRENVAFLHRDCEYYRSEGFQALNKIEIRAEGADKTNQGDVEKMIDSAKDGRGVTKE